MSMGEFIFSPRGVNRSPVVMPGLEPSYLLSKHDQEGTALSPTPPVSIPAILFLLINSCCTPFVSVWNSFHSCAAKALPLAPGLWWPSELDSGSHCCGSETPVLLQVAVGWDTETKTAKKRKIFLRTKTRIWGLGNARVGVLKESL